MPNPRKGEKTKDFVSRFMGNKEAVKDFPDLKQRAAVAYSKARKAGRKVVKKKDESFMFGLKTWSQFLNEEQQLEQIRVTLLEELSAEENTAIRNFLTAKGNEKIYNAYSKIQERWITRKKKAAKYANTPIHQLSNEFREAFWGKTWGSSEIYSGRGMEVYDFVKEMTGKPGEPSSEQLWQIIKDVKLP